MCCVCPVCSNDDRPVDSLKDTNYCVDCIIFGADIPSGNIFGDVILTHYFNTFAHLLLQWMQFGIDSYGSFVSLYLLIVIIISQF